ncbi:MAG: acyl-CoA dehydrogenase family protein [Acidobacteriota bacterium]
MLDPTDVASTARRLAPILAERASAAERIRQLPADTLRQLAEAGLFDLLTPDRFGGLEESPQLLVEVVKAIGRGCGSSAWVLSLLAIHNWLIGRAPETVQQTLFDDGEPLLMPLTLSSSAGTATPVDGGYRLNGRWAWLTAIHHANWVALTTPVQRSDPSSPPEQRVMFLRPDQIEVLDTWHTLGLCATGTHDIRIEEAFVPAEMAPTHDAIFGELKAEHPPEPTSIYRLPVLALFACVNAAPAIGIARGACDHFSATLKETARRGRGLRPSHLVRLAEAEAEIEAADALLERALDAMLGRQREGSPVSDRRRFAWRLQASHSVRLCQRAISRLFEAGGLRAHDTGSPLGRAFRDVQTLSTHVAFDQEAATQEYALASLGLSRAARPPGG